jgi:hypothetical protein
MHLASLLCWLQSRGTSTETYSVLHRTGTSSCIRSPAMDACTKPKADMQTMDLESGASSSQVKLTTPQRHTSSKLVLGLAITALILSLVGVGLGIAANVRASNNRSSLRDISRDDGVILVNSIRKADSEYKNAGALFAGTGYWARMRDMLFQRSDLRVSGYSRDNCFGQSNQCERAHASRLAPFRTRLLSQAMMDGCGALNAYRLRVMMQPRALMLIPQPTSVIAMPPGGEPQAAESASIKLAAICRVIIISNTLFPRYANPEQRYWHHAHAVLCTVNPTIEILPCTIAGTVSTSMHPAAAT